MDYATLKQSVAEDAAIRRRQRLQPVGGPGDKLFPPTYPGEGRSDPRHVVERRRVAGEDIWCALLDSVQSQANRLEEALLAAVREGVATVPYVTVDFRKAQLAGIEEITSLDAPHRVYDAILRDSLLDEQPFPKSDLGKLLAEAKPANAAAILEVSPNALLFGAWNSTGEGGGLGAKFARTLVSEVVAIGVAVEEAGTNSRTGEVQFRSAGRRTGSRIDPLGVLKGVQIYQDKDDPKGWTSFPEGAAKLKGELKLYKGRDNSKGKPGTPAKINHGNIPPEIVKGLGVTCDYAEHVAVISFAGLRRLAFGGGEKDSTGRAFLAALGLLALAEQDARGYALRSRCDLVCEDRAPLQRVLADGQILTVELDRAKARALYREALEETKRAGLNLRDEPIRLVPQEKLVEIVRKSQQLALVGEGGDADEVSGG